MADEARRAAPEPTRWQRALKAYRVVGDILTPTRIAVLLTAIALTVVGLAGGWESATATDTSDIPVLEVDQPHEAAPFELTVKALRWGESLPGVVPAQEGYRYLFLVVDATNTSAAPVSFTLLQRAATLDAAGLLSTPSGVVLHPRIYRIQDSQLARTYSPDVSVASVLVWQQVASEPLPETLTVTLQKFVWRHSVVAQSDGWYDETPSATLTLPVKALAGS